MLQDENISQLEKEFVSLVAESFSVLPSDLENAIHGSGLNDFKVLQMGWIFDIHFPRTFQIILKRRYLEKIHSSINNSDKADEILNITRLCLERKLRYARSTDAIWQ